MIVGKEEALMKVEYRVCAAWGEAPGQVEEALNSKLKCLGEEGWRFLETIYAPNSLPLLLFKKRTPSNARSGGDKTAGVPQGKAPKQK
jgi:hypothetical protein